jgi:hypothetical protein
MTEATESTAFISDDTGEDVAVLGRLPGELFDSSAPLDGDEWQAMVYVVAAAPELLAALKELVHYDEGSSEQGSYGYEVLGRCKSAIAKAEGRNE